MIGGKIKVETHLKYINKKIGFMTTKLFPLRNLEITKLNMNLFKTFLMPQYRLCLA